MILIDSDVIKLLNANRLETIARDEVLITGAGGMIGSYFAKFLLSSCDILGISRPIIHLWSNSGNIQNLVEIQGQPGVNVFIGPHAFELIPRSVSHVFHFGSPSFQSLFQEDDLRFSNIEISRKIFTSFSQLQFFCFASTSEVYGVTESDSISEEDVPNVNESLARSIYPKVKFEAEKLVTDFGKQNGIQVAIPRLFHTFGPGVRANDERSFAEFIWRAANQMPVKLHTDGKSLRSFLYLADTVSALFKIEIKKFELPINVGSQKETSILEFAKLVSSVGNVPFSRIERRGLEIQSSPNLRLKPNLLKIHNLGWEEEFTLEEAVSKTLGWAQKFPKEKSNFA
jgi:nucleoside-diphosphate-sugar epimerase